jgi:hypothetical protein
MIDNPEKDAIKWRIDYDKVFASSVDEFPRSHGRFEQYDDHGAQDRRSRFEQKILLPWAQSQCGQTEKEER